LGVDYTAMHFGSLLVCDELNTLETLCRVLDEARMDREICTDAQQAAHLVQERKFEAVVVDCDDMEGGQEFLSHLRRVSLNRYAIVLAIINGSTSVNQAFEMGANFVLDKPVVPELFLRSLRAAQGFMLREQRRFYRHPVDMLVTIHREKKKDLHFSAKNISEGGLCLLGIKQLKMQDMVGLEFHIPEIKMHVQGTAEIVWIDAEMRAGLRFLRIPRETQLSLREWLGAKFDEAASQIFINASRPA